MRVPDAKWSCRSHAGMSAMMQVRGGFCNAQMEIHTLSDAAELRMSGLVGWDFGIEGDGTMKVCHILSLSLYVHLSDLVSVASNDSLSLQGTLALGSVENAAPKKNTRELNPSCLREFVVWTADQFASMLKTYANGALSDCHCCFSYCHSHY